MDLEFLASLDCHRGESSLPVDWSGFLLSPILHAIECHCQRLNPESDERAAVTYSRSRDRRPVLPLAAMNSSDLSGTRGVGPRRETVVPESRKGAPRAYS